MQYESIAGGITYVASYGSAADFKVVTAVVDVAERTVVLYTNRFPY